MKKLYISGKDTPPAATLHSRPKDGKADNFPAPGDYNPEKAEKVTHESTPKFTFGLKTQVEKTSSTPGKTMWMIFCSQWINSMLKFIGVAYLSLIFVTSAYSVQEQGIFRNW